jgi:hypothetical protein
MAAWVTYLEYRAGGGPVTTDQQADRVPLLLQDAEDYLLLMAGCAFYDPSDRDAQRSRSWRYAVVQMTKAMMALESDAWQKSRESPYDFQSAAGQSYRLKDVTDQVIASDPYFARILEVYRSYCAVNQASPGLSRTPARA